MAGPFRAVVELAGSGLSSRNNISRGNQDDILFLPSNDSFVV